MPVVNGMKIRQIREHRLMTLRDVAALTQLNPTAISEIERGKKQPRIQTIKKLAAALEVRPDELLADDQAGSALDALPAVQETAPTLEELLTKPLDELTEDEAQRLLAIDPNDWAAPVLSASKRDYLATRFRRY